MAALSEMGGLHGQAVLPDDGIRSSGGRCRFVPKQGTDAGRNHGIVPVTAQLSVHSRKLPERMHGRKRLSVL